MYYYSYTYELYYVCLTSVISNLQFLTVNICTKNFCIDEDDDLDEESILNQMDEGMRVEFLLYSSIRYGEDINNNIVMDCVQ